jgi:hypothetical protein
LDALNTGPSFVSAMMSKERVLVMFGTPLSSFFACEKPRQSFYQLLLPFTFYTTDFHASG